jgi:hypothetical protein
MGSVKQALHFFDQGKRLANNSGFVFLDQLFAANLRLLWIQICVFSLAWTFALCC